MARKKFKTENMRIHEDLARQIKELANKNNLEFTQASKEIARINKIRFRDKRIVREIKF